MAISQKEQGMVERHLDKWNKEEHNHFQCPLVQETVKKGKPALIGKIMVLGSYRIFIFDKAKTSSSKDSTPSKDKDKDKGKSSSSSKPKKGVLGLAKVSKIAQAVSKEKEVIEIPYFDVIMLEHNGKSKFILKIKTRDGKSESLSFRTDSTPTITEKICHLRHKIAGMAPPLKLIGPPLTFTEQLVPFVPDSPTAHYLSCLPAWCNYYGVQLGIHITNWIKMLEALKIRDLDLTQAPGFELGSDSTMCIAPLVLSLNHDVFFKGLIIHDLPRKETIEEAAETIRNNRSLTKVVLVNLDGDSQGFTALGNALEENPTDTIQILDISSNKVGVGMDAITKAIARYKTPLTYLNISNCFIPARQLTDFFNALKGNEVISVNLEYLNVSHNKFDDETSTAFGNWGQKWAQKAKLRHMILAGTNFNFNSIVHFKLLPNLYELDISYNKIDTQLQLQCLWHFLDINPSVIKVSFANCGFGQAPVLKDSSELLRLIWSKHAQLPTIELNLSGNVPIGPMLAQAIDQAKNLTRLDLTGITVKEPTFLEIATTLSKIPNLVSVKLDNMLATRPPTQDVGRALANILNIMQLDELSVANGYGKGAILTMLDSIVGNNKTLKHLDISSNSICDQGAEKLAEFLIQDKVLLSIKLDCNGISLNGFNALYTALHYNSTLEYIYWATTDIEEAALKLPRAKKDTLYQVILNIQQRIQRFEIPPSNGYRFGISNPDKSLPPTPGADIPFSEDEELPPLPDTDDDPAYVSTINEQDDALVTASQNAGGSGEKQIPAEEKSMVGTIAPESGGAGGSGASDGGDSLLRRVSSKNFASKPSAGRLDATGQMSTIGEDEVRHTVTPVGGAVRSNSTPRKDNDGDEAESGSAEDNPLSNSGAKSKPPANSPERKPSTLQITPATPPQNIPRTTSNASMSTLPANNSPGGTTSSSGTATPPSSAVARALGNSGPRSVPKADSQAKLGSPGAAARPAGVSTRTLSTNTPQTQTQPTTSVAGRQWPPVSQARGAGTGVSTAAPSGTGAGTGAAASPGQGAVASAGAGVKADSDSGPGDEETFVNPFTIASIKLPNEDDFL